MGGLDLTEKITSYRDLKVWREAMSIAERIYEVTKLYPKEEVYGLTSQMRRCSVSIAANMGEGYGRDSGGSFVQFLKIAQGSLKELETHAILSARLGYLAETDVDDLLFRCDELGRMLGGLIRSVKRRSLN